MCSPVPTGCVANAQMTHFVPARARRLAFHLRVMCAFSVAAACTVLPSVDHFVATPALDAALTPLFGWQLSSDCGGEQLSYRIRVTPLFTSAAADDAHGHGHDNIVAITDDDAWDSGVVQSNVSANVLCGAELAPGTQYAVVVTTDFAGAQSFSSAPTPFLTALSPDLLDAAPLMWHSDPTAQFVLFRRVLAIPPPPPTTTPGQASSAAEPTFLSLTAKPVPNLLLSHGNNSSKLLCAYKLWVDGQPLGTGPGRKIGGSVLVDTYNLTAAVARVSSRSPTGGALVVAVETYYLAANASDADDTGGVLAVLHDGRQLQRRRGGRRSRQLSQQQHHENSAAGATPLPAHARFRNAPDEWEAFDATAGFNPQNGASPHGAGTSYYNQPLEFMQGASLPQGWRTSTDGRSTGIFPPATTANRTSNSASPRVLSCSRPHRREHRSSNCEPW